MAGGRAAGAGGRAAGAVARAAGAGGRAAGTGGRAAGASGKPASASGKSASAGGRAAAASGRAAVASGRAARAGGSRAASENRRAVRRLDGSSSALELIRVRAEFAAFRDTAAAAEASVDQVNWYSNAEFSKVSQMLLVQHERYASAIQVLSTILHLVKLP